MITEFLRKVFWSGPHNTIVAPAGHHIMEGRWLRDDAIIDDYARFWRGPHGGGGLALRRSRSWPPGPPCSLAPRAPWPANASDPVPPPYSRPHAQVPGLGLAQAAPSSRLR